MHELSRYLFLGGACPFILLGVAHAMATPTGVGERKGLSPSDSDLAQAMARASVRLTRRTDVWRAWVGFNFSHSLGAVAFGCMVLMTGRSASAFATEGWLVVPFATVAAALYLGLAVRYWFRTPILGCALSVACFLGSWGALALGS
jgi:hypothetical protein